MADNEEHLIYKKRYKVEKKLGAGNFGTAYLVYDIKEKNEPKVLKAVRLGEMDSEQTVDSVREAELLSNLDNEHIVKFYESFIENDCLCIVTEYCEGGDLDQRLKELKKQNIQLQEDQIVEWLIEILLAVQYMHKTKVLHRDLKARNIFLKSNKIKIGDFGISRILVGTMDIATTFTGTPYYMSPEVMKHDGYESKSDIWSVGCLLYEMCTYQHAFDGKGLMNVIYKIVEGKPPELPKTYSKELNDLLKKIFLKDPKRRPSAAELLQTPFIIQHRTRTKLTGPLQNTVDGNIRAKAINNAFQTPKTFGQLKKDGQIISSKYYIAGDEEDFEDDSSLNKPYENEMIDEELTIKQVHTVKPAKQEAIEKKNNETVINGQKATHTNRMNINQTNNNRQMNNDKMNTKQSRPVAIETNEQEIPMTNRGRNPIKVSPVTRANNQTGAMNRSDYNSPDDRPITPMKKSYKQIAETFNDEYQDSRTNFRSPTRENQSSNENTLKSQRGTSATRHGTMNSLSHTLDPRHAPNIQQKFRQPQLGRTIGSAKRQNPPINPSHDEEYLSLKDDPNCDAYGRQAKDAKINGLRTKAIQKLGEATFRKVHDYLVTQRRANPDLDEAKLAQGLRAFVDKPSDCFLIDQLVFLELCSDE